jgi:ParB family transcriptional regulator, chromosome partitioning protein
MKRLPKRSLSSLILGVIEDIEINRLRPSRINCRNNDSEQVCGLANSILEKGLLQPIIARSMENYFEIVAGHRRYQACKALGWRKILCHIVELDDRDAMEISLVENIQRKSLDPREEAQAFRSYIENYGYGGISDLAARIGKSVSYIDKRVRLLELPREVLDSLCNSVISPSLAEELLVVKDRKKQTKIARLARSDSLTVHSVRKLVKEGDNIFESVYDASNVRAPSSRNIGDIDRRVQRSYDKSIIAIRMAMNKISDILIDIEDNWVVYESLVHHRKVLHSEIDILIKERSKL